MNHFKTFSRYSLFLYSFLFLLPSTAHGTLNRLLRPGEIVVLERNVETNPENIKSRLFLGSHYKEKKTLAKGYKMVDSCS